ncbi:MAG: hypothetical protein Q4D14_03400, partial [Bacteroidales bacterium]|nr:hypothetical protein [Bacteroidales bacterium]
QNITVQGCNINFNRNTFVYNITLAAGSTVTPAISYVKSNKHQSVTLETRQLTDTSYINVIAEDGITRQSYAIIFNVNHTTIDTLSDISINTTTLQNFSGNTFQYTYGTDDSWGEEVTYNRADEEATLIVTRNIATMQWSIGNNNYTLTWQHLPSHDATLDNIEVNDTAVNNFNSQTYDYIVTTSNTQTPSISVTKGDPNQSVTIEWDNNVATITVTAEDSTTTLEYTVTINQQHTASNNALLDNILLNGNGISTFVPTTTTYSVVLPEGTTNLPEIIVIKGEDNQTIQITQGTVNDTTVITVIAEDNITTTTYYIIFSVAKSDIATLDDIEVNGTSISNFDANTFTYSYVLPYGTTSAPIIGYTKGHVGEIVSVQGQGTSGVYTITVVSESGHVTNIYSISFSIEPSHNANLANILNNGSTLTGFDPLIYNYTITLPYGTTTLPIISYQPGDSVQVVTMTPATTVNDTTIITVTAEDGVTTTTYYITYRVALSNNALLDQIFINGEALIMQANSFIADSDFDPEDFYYNITLPYGTTNMPTITWRGQVADYTSITLLFDTIPGSAIITVTSQDGLVINDYTLFFTIKKSDYAYLNDLTIDNVTVSGFVPDSMTYHIVYPIGTDPTTLPDVQNIGYELGEPHQIVTVTNNDGAIVVTVVAEDGISTFTYVITFEILKSNNALLADLLINGISIDGFEPTRFEYEYLLPFGASIVPELTYVKGEPSQIVDVMMGFVNEYSYVYVTAEDGTEQTYAVFFRVSTDNPGEIPTDDDVALNYLGNGIWRASTTKNNVVIRVFSATGALIFSRNVPVADPNENIHQPDATGVNFKVGKEGKVYIYGFFYEKKRLKTGKIAY